MQTLSIDVKHRVTGAVLLKAGANLRGANLRGANLSGADLSRADLYEADLSRADLYGANLRGANLYEADLSRADLYGANLRGANLSGADLSRADLSRANLRGANLRGANLSGVNLRGANLRGANLRGANLSGVKNISALAAAQTSIVPETGVYEGWKKCQSGVIIHLQIPAKATRSNATGRKCRASEAIVLAVHGADFGLSMHNQTTRYVVGETVTCDAWCADRWQECAGGIHHYITRAEAEAHS